MNQEASAEACVKIGVMADDFKPQRRIRSALTHFGCTMVCHPPANLSIAALKTQAKEYGAWLVSLVDEEQWVDLMVELVELERLVLFGLEPAPEKSTEDYPLWEKKLYAKLCELLGRDLIIDSANAALELLAQNLPCEDSSPAVVPTRGEAADAIWVLCASLGGPDAVKKFLDRLPADLRLGFLYAQHIDAHFEAVLAKVLGRHSHYCMVQAKPGIKVGTGEVVIVPVSQEIMIDDEERLIFLGHP